MQPGIRINRVTLTAIILGAIFIPVGCALALFFWVKPIPEPSLNAKVRIDAMWVDDENDPNNKRLIPTITVLNSTQDPWKQL